VGIFDKLKSLPKPGKFSPSSAPHGHSLPLDHATLAGYGTPPGMGAAGGAEDVGRTGRATLRARVGATDPARTHTGRILLDWFRPVPVTDYQRRTAAMGTSLLLQYPDEGFHDTVAAVHVQIEDLPEEISLDSREFFQWAEAASVRDVEEH